MQSGQVSFKESSNSDNNATQGSIIQQNANWEKQHYR